MNLLVNHFSKDSKKELITATIMSLHSVLINLRTKIKCCLIITSESSFLKGPFRKKFFDLFLGPTSF